jgi:hypothetical protein
MSNYTISFDTTKNQFMIDFGNENLLHVDQINKIARKLHKGEVVDYFDTTGMRLETFTQIVFNTAKSLENGSK